MVTNTPYDSTNDTMAHIQNVRSKIMKVVADLIERGFWHDRSKLEEPEKSIYDKHYPELKSFRYGTDAYKAVTHKIKVATDHHYSVNRHHPEYFADGINGMNLVDLLEMLLDCKAASEHPTNGTQDIFKSIEINAERFHMEPQLKQILLNTATYLWYE